MRLKRTISFVFLVYVLLASGCSSGKSGDSENAKPMNPHDPHSYARPWEISVRHLSLDLSADFEKRILSGVARLEIQNHAEADTLFLDSRFLDIRKVTLGVDEHESKFSLGKEDALLGSALAIPVFKDTKTVNIYYSTTERSSALQWLNPSQTAGKAQPFLFTQSQAILARTWIPIQDGPGMRFTYDAKIQVPAHLMAVMSASNPKEKSANGIYQFEMDIPIPAYLMALAVGDIDFREIGPRTGVYSEKAVIAKAHYEFGEMENMLVAAEKLYGPYRWGRYDVIVLPPSFPFGGMENPRLTFATPTILAGDRSLTSLIAHEMAHSWSGNLVTNATWDDFWLNEGFTVYFENRIMEAIYGRDFSEMEAILAKQELEGTLKEFMQTRPADTKLKLELKGRDPDDGLSDIAYIKGYFFLRHIEETVGRARFDTFLRKYFDAHAFSSMTTEGFEAYVMQELIGADSTIAKKINMNGWIHSVGLPSDCPVPVSGKFTAVDEEAAKWRKGASPQSLSTRQWSTQEWLHFLRQLPDTVSPQTLASLDQEWAFSRSGNAEIQCEWFMHCIHADYAPAYPKLEEFLFSVGRRKFLKPLYTELIRTEKGKQLAMEYYRKSRPNYHYVAVSTLDALLGFTPQ